MEKIIENTNNLYSVTDDGKVISYNKYPEGHVLSPALIGNGYKAVVIKYSDGKFKMKYIHRLVAEAFVPNPDGYPIINHIDENKLNNHSYNLEWCTAEYNCNYTSKKNIPRKASESGAPKRVALLDENGEIERVFYAISDAANFIKPENPESAYVMIAIVCHGKKNHKTACGRKWKFIDDVTFLKYINEHPEWLEFEDKKQRHTNLVVKERVEKTIVKYNPKTGQFSAESKAVRLF